MPIRQQYRGGISSAIPAALPCRFDEPINLRLREIFPLAIGGVRQSPQCSVYCRWRNLGHVGFVLANWDQAKGQCSVPDVYPNTAPVRLERGNYAAIDLAPTILPWPIRHPASSGA